MRDSSWYFSQNLKPQGPLTYEEMREKIHRGEIGPYDLISQDGDWKPACEWGIFERTLFPATQAFTPGAVEMEDEKEWVLLVPGVDGNGALQEGPFSVRQLREGLLNKSVSGQQYIWKAGLSGWCRLKDRPEFMRIAD